MTMTKSRTVAGSCQAREYLRVSQDRNGRMRSPAEQHDDNAAHAEREGWALGEPYAEREAVGASRYSRGTRDGFADLTADLEAGRFGADLLIMWESSRGSRRLSEWARFLELLEDNGVRLYVTSHGRLYDLANPRDRRTMQEDGSDNEYEVAKLRGRVLRAMAANAAAGRPHGQTPYGYLAERDQRGKLINWVPDPERAPIVAELFDRLRQGHSFRGIAADFAARGIVNKGIGGREPGPFVAAHLRVMAQQVCYIGKRSHHGEVTNGTWPPIVDAETFYIVQRILSDPKRVTTRHGRAVHVYSMIVRCGVCSGPVIVAVRGNHADARARYQCLRKGCVKIAKADVDEILDAVIIGYLSSDKVYAEFAARPEDAGRAEKVGADLAEARLRLQEAEGELPATVYEAKALGKLTEALTATVARLEAEERDLTTPPALRNYLEPGADVAARWEAAPVAAKRAVAQILLSPEVLGEVRITRSPRPPAKVPAIDRIEWRRDGS
jgi:DNA invertase Pin-like site-specific DNA recombinase